MENSEVVAMVYVSVCKLHHGARRYVLRQVKSIMQLDMSGKTHHVRVTNVEDLTQGLPI